MIFLLNTEIRHHYCLSQLSFHLPSLNFNLKPKAKQTFSTEPPDRLHDDRPKFCDILVSGRLGLQVLRMRVRESTACGIFLHERKRYTQSKPKVAAPQLTHTGQHPTDNRQHTQATTNNRHS